MLLERQQGYTEVQMRLAGDLRCVPPAPYHVAPLLLAKVVASLRDPTSLANALGLLPAWLQQKLLPGTILLQSITCTCCPTSCGLLLARHHVLGFAAGRCLTTQLACAAQWTPCCILRSKGSAC